MLRFWLVLLCLCSSLACATPQDEDLAYSLGAKLGERLRDSGPTDGKHRSLRWQPFGKIGRCRL